jgi:hypothetical protein
MDMASKKYLIPVFAVVIFLVVFAVRFYPVFHKGYPPSIRADSLILARNLSLEGEYKIEDEKGIILTTPLLGERGVPSNIANNLTSVLYAKLFDIFGFNPQLPLYVSLALYALSTVLVFVLVFRLFNLWLALIFALVDIFSPIILANSIFPGSYEWAILFFSIALLIYFKPQYGKEIQLPEKNGRNYLRLVFAGLFFGLASLAGNVYTISFVPFLIYEFYRNKSLKRAFIFLLPFVLLWGIYLGPTFIKEGVIINNANLTSLKPPSSDYLHLWPDSYTYLFEKDEYVDTLSDTRELDLIAGLMKYNYHVSFLQKLWIYLGSGIFYIKEFFRLTTIGGALTILLMFLGAGYLYKKKNNLLPLFIFWFVIWFLALVLYRTNSNHHFAELRFPIFLLISLGAYWVFRVISRLNIGRELKYFLILGLLSFILLDLIQSDKWLFHEKYENGNMNEVLTIVETLKQKDIKTADVTAVGTAANNAPLAINYYDNLNVIYFDPNTIEKLLNENRLQLVFDQFGVTGIVGYQPELTKRVIENTKVKSF